MRRLSIWWMVVKLSCFILCELVLKQGLWMRFLEDNLPRFVAESGAAWLIVGIYVAWLFVEPIVFGIALVTKDRELLVKHIS